MLVFLTGHGGRGSHGSVPALDRHRQSRCGSTKLQVSIGRERDQEGHEEISIFLLQLNSSAECHLWKVRKAHCSSLTVKKKRKAREPWQCTTSAMHISMEYQCEESLYNSPMITHEKKDTIWNKLACWESTCMAQWTAVLVGKRMTRRSWKRNEFVQGLSSPSLCVHAKRDMRLLIHGDDFMVEMPTHEEKLFESVLFSKYDGRCTGKFHSDGNTAMEASFLNCVIWWDPRLGNVGSSRYLSEFHTISGVNGSIGKVRNFEACNPWRV